MVHIQQLDWIDTEHTEAEALFELNGKYLWDFCYPCDFKEGQTAEVDFSFIEEEISECAFWDENKNMEKEILPSKSNRCYYYCYGQLKSLHPVVIDCGTITFIYGDCIDDERVIGSYVYFVISRLDISKIIYQE